MTRRAFDTRGIWAISYFRCLETPYSDVLEHNPVPATRTKWSPEETPGTTFCLVLILSAARSAACSGGSARVNDPHRHP